ncbi:cytochrome C oxidase subunit IV family protein [Halovivax limisalsi]|uniref:cytochrome C oxidase subunit IV family protein n=1 Tax=Halovivax limisalsi TaxID=1453760 RepID=UPI001FFDC589|nr:cytochrome C oxidase subunit IV family protein [Halovivax limisalsi]
MTSVRNYTIIYALLLAAGTGKFLFTEISAIPHDLAIGGILVLALIKVLLIAGFFQHLKDEPRSVSYTMGLSVFMVFLLVLAAGYSIQ